MQQHVEQGKLHLAQGLHAALEVFGRQHFVEQGAGQGLACFYVGGHVAQHIPFPAEVFHELAGQLHRVPLHAADAGYARFVHLREHVVQAVTKLVEQGDDVVVREQGRLARHAFGKVAYQVRHGCLQRLRVGAQPAAAHVVHPGAAALAVAGGGVQIEAAQQLTVALQPVKLHTVVPCGGGVARDAYFKQVFYDLEQACQHARCGEVLLDFLLAEGVAGFFQFFADVGPIPRLGVGQVQLFAGKVAQVLHVFFGKGAGFAGQVAQKVQHLLRAFGHFGHERYFRKMGVAQQLGFFLPQGEDFGHDGAVVELFGVAFGLIAGACVVGAVEFFAQGAAVGELHYGQVAGDFQRQFVAVFAVCLGGGARGLHHVLRHAGQFFFIGVVGPVVGGV